MKPENHAIRQLEQQLEGATPAVRDAMSRVIFSLEACLMNAKDPAALDFCRRKLAEETANLGQVLKREAG